MTWGLGKRPRRAAVRGAAIRNSGARRARTVRRASPRLSPVRAVAALVMLASLAAAYGVTAVSAFAVRSVTLALTADHASLTTEAQVRAKLGLVNASPNVFLVATDELAARLRDMPAISSASVAAGLPGTLRVSLVEREPILVWRTPGHRFLVDREGLIMADADRTGSDGAVSGADGTGGASEPVASQRVLPAASGSASTAARTGPPASGGGSPAADAPASPNGDAGALPIPAASPATDTRLEALVARLPGINDRRAESAALAVGDRLDPIDLDVATRLGSLVPADIGSSAADLSIAVDDSDGYTMVPLPSTSPAGKAPGWTAVFGFYTQTIRRPDLIPGQVRVLRSLLAGRENTIGRIVVADDHGGTYEQR